MKQTQKISFTHPEFYLIGIASHENDYRLAWAINSALNISLTKGEDVVLFHDKYKHDISVPVFLQDFTDQGYTIKLFPNRGDNFFLLEEIKNFDFLLKIDGEISDKKVQNIISVIKGIDIVMGAFALDVKTIKKPQRIQF